MEYKVGQGLLSPSNQNLQTFVGTLFTTMASGGEPAHSKRLHVKTERMQEFIRQKGEAQSPHKRMKCPEQGCDKVFTSIPGLKYHAKKHDTSDTSTFSCSRCQKIFQSGNGLKYHLEKTKCEDLQCATHDTSPVNHAEGPQTGDTFGAKRRLDMKMEEENVNMKEEPESTMPRRFVVPPPLSLGSNLENESGVDKLTELAIIATGPQSPLLQNSSYMLSMDIKIGDSKISELQYKDWNHRSKESDPDQAASDCYTKTSPLENIQYFSDTNGNYVDDESDHQVSSTSPPTLAAKDNTWSHTWPTAVWHSFIKGTLIHFMEWPNSLWQAAETLAQKEELSLSASRGRGQKNRNVALSFVMKEGLMVLKLFEFKLDNMVMPQLEIHFGLERVRGKSGSLRPPILLVRCQLDHPFFVRDKGWSSYHPVATNQHFGIPCNELLVSDVCLPPGELSFGRYYTTMKDFTYEDTNAVLALESMKRRKEPDSSPRCSHFSPAKTKRPAKGEPKPKRPMNGFMLFAKEFRMEYSHMNPNKDNRTISVMLGEKWRGMSDDKKQLYGERARVMAEEQKKIHPDCWKRKR
ncbi:hypothetical protein CHS0354_005242 [Potamilus streckersoni]|uniref:HMG box-containing protein 1 n=1 Tax=Potamilus streckersoni TaxID=2493646 RepID=A0AAE0TJ63_9BIVA|nr:hypothetical protein CHS0354_005242 [Potamilus streckersoni]